MRLTAACLLVASVALAGGSELPASSPAQEAAQLLEVHRQEAQHLLETQLHAPIDLRIDAALNAELPGEIGCFRKGTCLQWQPQLAQLRAERAAQKHTQWSLARRGAYLLLLNHGVQQSQTQAELEADRRLRASLAAPCTANCSGFERPPAPDTRQPVSAEAKAVLTAERDEAFSQLARPLEEGTDCLSAFFRSQLALFARGAAVSTPCSEETRLLSLIDAVTYATAVELGSAIRKLEAASGPFSHLVGVEPFVLHQRTRLALCTGDEKSMKRAAIALAKLPDGAEISKAVRLLMANPASRQRADIRQMLGCGIAD